VEVKIVSNDNQLQEAFSIRKKVFVDEQLVPLEEEIDQYEEESIHFLLYDENLPIGAGRFRSVDGIGKVERICVLENHRKSGSGKAIMDKIEEYGKSEGYRKFKLNAQTHAIPFYSKLGYEIISDEFLDAGIPHRTMIKQI
jgi:predicted GNAT family N-acyltransferase